jgi:hypothetical protein
MIPPKPPSTEMFRGFSSGFPIKKKIYIAGWWLPYPSEKYEFVSWDDDIPIYNIIYY